MFYNSLLVVCRDRLWPHRVQLSHGDIGRDPLSLDEVAGKQDADLLAALSRVNSHDLESRESAVSVSGHLWSWVLNTVVWLVV